MAMPEAIPAAGGAAAPAAASGTVGPDDLTQADRQAALAAAPQQPGPSYAPSQATVAARNQAQVEP